MSGGGEMPLRKRKHSRYVTVQYLVVKHLLTEEPVGFVGNLSAGGVMLYTREPFPSRNGEIHPLVLVVPEADKEAHIYMPVRRIWCQKSSLPGLYAAGFKLEGLSEQGRREIIATIARFACETEEPEDSPMASHAAFAHATRDAMKSGIPA
ncbi:MAG: PilZ domain-containing protein [Lentisphaerae bacterium]|nr:PilZ domain-containing protein [Lentisphaerota bacterium]